MRTFTTDEDNAVDCSFAGKKRQLRIGTFTKCVQVSSQLCTNFERQYQAYYCQSHLCTSTRKNLWIFLYILISCTQKRQKMHLCTFTTQPTIYYIIYYIILYYII